MATQEKVTQIKRLAKISEGIEKEINSELVNISNMLKTIFQLKKQIPKRKSKVSRMRNERQIGDLMEGVRRCNLRISLLRRQLSANQLLCKHKLLQTTAVAEGLDSPSVLKRGNAICSFDWKALLSMHN